MPEIETCHVLFASMEHEVHRGTCEALVQVVRQLQQRQDVTLCRVERGDMLIQAPRSLSRGQRHMSKGVEHPLCSRTRRALRATQLD